MNSPFSRALVLALALSLAVGGALAQTKGAAAPAKPETAPRPPADTPAPYEPQLLRLAEIIGALTYLRDLCGDKDGDQWRARMTALLDAESTDAERKERLAGAYNRGFRGYETTYRTCTPNAEIVIARYLDEGGRIARDVSNRFSGG